MQFTRKAILIVFTRSFWTFEKAHVTVEKDLGLFVKVGDRDGRKRGGVLGLVRR